eukprot:Skav216913  [mRNA]  locus=scaffold3288:107392:111339:+ [translate_table: standard]
MCRALSSRIPSELHTLRVSNGPYPLFRIASKRSIANSWRQVVDWVGPNLKKLDMAFGEVRAVQRAGSQALMLVAHGEGSRAVAPMPSLVMVNTGLEELRLDFQQEAPSSRVRPLGAAALEQLAAKLSQMSHLRGPVVVVAGDQGCPQRPALPRAQAEAALPRARRLGDAPAAADSYGARGPGSGHERAVPAPCLVEPWRGCSWYK